MQVSIARALAALLLVVVAVLNAADAKCGALLKGIDFSGCALSITVSCAADKCAPRRALPAALSQFRARSGRVCRRTAWAVRSAPIRRPSRFDAHGTTLRAVRTRQVAIGVAPSFELYGYGCRFTTCTVARQWRRRRYADANDANTEASEQHLYTRARPAVDGAHSRSCSSCDRRPSQPAAALAAALNPPPYAGGKLANTALSSHRKTLGNGSSFAMPAQRASHATAAART